MRPPENVASLIASIEPAHRADAALVRERLDHLTKPPGSLGHLEDLALRLALIYGDPPPALRRRVVFVLAADHGIAQRGVSAYPTAVTAQMCRNLAAGSGTGALPGALRGPLTGRAAAEVVGPGTGVAGDRLAHKRAIVECAVGRIAAEDDPFEILRQVGGLELAGLAGVVLGAAH